MFENREDAARELAERLQFLELRDPLVLAIPRGGIVIGKFVARELLAELDVIVVQKLFAPDVPKLAIGAVAEDGSVYLNHWIELVSGIPQAYIEKERQRRLAETARRSKLFRAVRPAVPIDGRSVILADEGVITGATMLAALQAVKAQKPYEVIVAVPVGPPDRLKEIRNSCDQTLCVFAPSDFYTIGQFYKSFDTVTDEDVVRILRGFAPVAQPAL